MQIVFASELRGRWVEDLGVLGLLRDAHGAAVAQLEVELAAATELTLTDFDVLNALASAEAKRLRMADLAAAIRMSPSGLTRRFDVLVERGWVRRDSCDDDRRGIVGVVVGAGIRQLAAAAPVYERIEQTFRRDVVTAEDLESFERVMSRFKLLE